jgi:rfaE bifunctional protein nucleotidyltransferase chain/domain
LISPTSSESRVLSVEELVLRFGRPREDRLVFSNGVFDLLHSGHVASLEAARGFGDSLVVAVNSDGSTRRLKGPGRPIQPEADRARLVAALRCVDAVTIFDDDTPARLIEQLLPDVLVKGADYSVEQIVGADAVLAAGGEVRLIELERGRSTSELIRRLQADS